MSYPEPDAATASTTTEPPDTAALVGQAIGVLTAIARQSRVRGAGTPSAATEAVDVADLVAHILTSVAANVGGVGTLLAGRSGSWEAELVRRLVTGTAGEDGELLRWRTEPVRLVVDAEDVFFDFGVGDLHGAEYGQAIDREADDTLSEAQNAAAGALATEIERLFESDQAAYVEAYRVTALRYLTERGASCGVDIVTAPAGDAAAEWDELTEQIHEYARAHTPLPMTGAVPDFSEGTAADALRRTGRTYTARAQLAINRPGDTR